MFPYALALLRPARYKSLFATSLLLLLLTATHLHAASVRGVITDTTGARVTGAKVSLVIGRKAVATAVSASDGSFQLLSGDTGHMFLMISASGFRQLSTPDFYAGKTDSIERNLVLEPEWTREAIVVTATGTPTPQTQTSEATSVLSPLDLELRSDLVSALRLMPGTVVTQSGQRGAQSSLFVRGGNSVANKVLLDGVSVNDIGGNFDFGALSTAAVESVEVYRGPNSSLYGADAGSSVLSLTTPHGTTSFPSIIFEADGGNLSTGREQLTVAGTRNKIDYLGAYSWLQTSNDVDRDQYHVSTTAANLGWSPTGSTQVRGTLHYGVSASGSPNAWDFYQVADNATQKDQDLFVSASVNNQTTTALHNSFRYGLSRKREQYTQWGQAGTADSYGDTFGNYLTIAGANGYKASGQALLDYSGTYPYNNQVVSNRDQLVYQGDYQATQHLSALVGFRFEQERGLQKSPTYSSRTAIGRTNYDYLAAVHGDFKNRFYYTLGGNLEHYSNFGTQTASHAGLSYFILKPRTGIFSGTRILFNYGDAVREATLTNQTGSLYTFLVNNGFQSNAQQLHIGPLAAPTTRTYEGGLEQRFFSQRLLFRTTYFHNQFGKEIESVPAPTLLTLVPGLTKEELGYYYTYNYGLSVNTQAFRAQGIETTVEAGIGRYLFLRGGYTYLDAVVQRSFTSDNEAGFGLTYNDNGKLIPLGGYTPLVGARPFRRPPHTGFFSAAFAEGKLTGVFNAAFASRSDDSTFLEGMDANYSNSLLLPNRNLDYGYAKIDLGGSYQSKSWLVFYTQGENLMNNQHIAPIGYPSLPFTVRSGIRILLGPGSGR